MVLNESGERCRCTLPKVHSKNLKVTSSKMAYTVNTCLVKDGNYGIAQ